MIQASLTTNRARLTLDFDPGPGLLRSFQAYPIHMDNDEATPTNAGIANANRPCVLLVEDDRSARRFLEVTLQRCGYKVIAAADGLEAMKLALASPIDAVVTDAIMPYLSGQQLARFLRNNERLSRVPIVLLTGQENRDAASSLDDSIDAFLCKPVKAEELKSCLAGLLRRT